MTLQQKFYEKSLIERSYLKLIFDNLPKNYDYKTYMTPADGKDIYDAILLRFEKNSSKLIDRYIIEIKVRDTHYPELMLERIKYNDLKRLRTRLDNKTNSECYTEIKSRLVYISVTPQGTYWFDLDKLQSSFNWTTERHWRSTTNKAAGKIEKELTLINIKMAKHFNIKTGDYFNKQATERLMVSHSRTKQLGIIF